LTPKIQNTVVNNYRIIGCKNLILGVILIISSGITRAQDPEFTQFYANPLYLNPAFAGSNNCPRVALNYRNQWPALSGTFVTTSVSYDQHVDGLYGGLGLMVVSDQAGKGTLNTNRISGIYSYQLKVNREFSIRQDSKPRIFKKA
jgi:type IX secretion system PorP/SprF family membrane protein